MNERTTSPAANYWHEDEEQRRYFEVADIIIGAAEQGQSIKRVLRRVAAATPPHHLVTSGVSFAARKLWSDLNTTTPGVAIYDYGEQPLSLKGRIQSMAVVEPCVEMVRYTIHVYENSFDPTFSIARLMDLKRMLELTTQQLSKSIRRVSQRRVPSVDDMSLAIPSLVEAPPIQPSISWIESSIELYEAGKREESLDVIFDNMDDLLLEEKFDECDEALSQVRVEELSNPQMLTFLTATAAAKDRLPSRDGFFRRVKLVLIERGADSSRLLAGLE